jgi:hypothetical protein
VSQLIPPYVRNTKWAHAALLRAGRGVQQDSGVMPCAASGNECDMHEPCHAIHNTRKRNTIFQPQTQASIQQHMPFPLHICDQVA